MTLMDKWLSFTPLLGVGGLISVIFGVAASVMNIQNDKTCFSPVIQTRVGILLIVFWANPP